MHARIICAYFLFAVAPQVAFGAGTIPSPYSLLQTFNDPTPNGDTFGGDVALDGGLVLVGNGSDITNGINIGQAHLFDRTTGTLLHTFTDPTPTTNDFFGSSLALDSGLALVAARGDDTNSMNAGQAHLFDTSTGSLLKTFNFPIPFTGPAGLRFGTDVAIDNGIAVVSDPRCLVNNVPTGQVYLFDALSGNLLHTLDDPTPTSNDYFGFAVDINGNHALVGALQDKSIGSNAGQAHVFDATTGTLIRTFDNPNPITSPGFGRSVAIDGDFALIGSYFGANVGMAYLFDITTGTLLQTFEDPTPTDTDWFSSSVAISNGRVLIGERNDDTLGPNIGQAHLFDALTGELLQTFNDPTPTTEDHFGTWSDLDGDFILIGATGDDTNGENTGQVYLFGPTTTVPEPASWALLAITVLAAGAIRRG